jgi:hypothetical protein
VHACKLDFLKQIRQTIAAKGGSMGLNEILAWVNLGLLVVGFITLWVGIGRKLGSLQADFANGLKSIQAQMKSYGILLNILSTKKLFTSAEIQEINKPYQEFSHQDAINQLLNRIKAGNPISQDELERLKKYVARTQQGELLTKEEARDFYNISKKIESEDAYKTDVGAILLVGLAAFILGLVIGSSNGAASQ